MAFVGANRGENVGSFRLPRPQAEIADSQPVKSFWEELKKIDAQSVETRQKQQPTGHQFIDFELNDAQVETKVKQLTQKELIKQQGELKQIVDQRTNSLRAYVENQLRNSQLSMATLRGDLAKSLLQQASMPHQQQQHYVESGVGSQIHSRKDVKSALISDVQQVVAQEALQCQPIRGIDLPIATEDLLLQVEDIDPKEVCSTLPQKGGILSMLLPNELKAASQDFLEEEDIDCLPVVVQPQKTPAQRTRDTKQHEEAAFEKKAREILEQEKEDELMKISADERQKTIKCMYKILEHQFKQVECQAQDVMEHANRNDAELEAYRREMAEHDRQIQLKELQDELERTKRVAMSYKPSTDQSAQMGPQDERQDLAEIVADNQVLMARVEELLTHDGVARVHNSESMLSSEDYSLTTALIDDLYEQAQQHLSEKRVKSQQKGQKQVVTNDWITSGSSGKKQLKSVAKPAKSSIKSTNPKTGKAGKQVTYNTDITQSVGPIDQSTQSQVVYSASRQKYQPMSQIEIDAQKRQKMNDLKNRYQMVFFPPAGLDEKPVKETQKQKELSRINKLLDYEVGEAMQNTAQLLKKAFQ